MRKQFLTAALAFAALATAAPMATAASFEITHPGTFTMTSSSITFAASGFVNLSCSLTLTGGWQAGLFNKVTGARIGSITEVRWSRCTGGEVVRVLTPINIIYQAIAGTLPSAVTAFEFYYSNWGWSISNGEIECLYAGGKYLRSALNGTNPYTSTGTVPITRDSIGGGTGFCAFLTGSMTGTYNAISFPLRILRL